MKREEALEYSESLAQIGNGWWRQVLWASRQAIPDALGMSTDEWRVAYYGHLRLPPEERREAVAELAAEGMKNTEIAEVLGVSDETVRRDKQTTHVVSDTPTDEDPVASTTTDVVPGQTSWDDLAAAVVPEERRARMELDAALVAEGMGVVETVNRWAEYLTDQDRRIVENMMAGLGRALRSGPVKLESIR